MQTTRQGAIGTSECALVPDSVPGYPFNSADLFPTRRAKALNTGRFYGKTAVGPGATEDVPKVPGSPDIRRMRRRAVLAESSRFVRLIGQSVPCTL